MPTKTINISDPRIRTIRIGGMGEENATEIIFDCSKFAEWYGDTGTASVVVQRYSEDPYIPANQVYDSDAHTLTWTVSGTDTSVDATGVAEVRFAVDDEVLAKTPLYNLEIRRNIYASTEDAPEWYEDYLAELQELATTTTTNAASAAESAEAAATSETNAATSETNAATSETNAAASATSAAASAATATEAAETAWQYAEQTAYMFTSFNDETGIMTVTLSDALAEDMTITTDYSSGTLEVTIV